MKKVSTTLIVDDDEDDKEMFIEVVSEIDNSTHCIQASNGYEALEILEKNISLPDLIFLDLNMPRMNGKQCLQSIKNNEKYSSIPVIICTTSKLAEDKEDAINFGATRFITKPSSINSLRKELESFFNKSRKTNQQV